jgi:hypothetical protein
MQTPRRHLTQHRFRRIILWALAALTWITAILSDNRFVSARHKAQRFDISLLWLTHLVGRLLLIRAGQLARIRRKPLPYWRRGRDLRRTHLFRSVLGANMRRALKHKDARTWIATLITALCDLDTHAAKLVKRLRRGLTRLLRFWTPSIHASAVYGAPASAPALSDSS